MKAKITIERTKKMKLYAFLADGFETVEALAVIDVLRRGKIDVCTVSISDKREVTSAHSIPVIADKIFDDCDFSDGDAIFLPGGMPGTLNLEAHAGLSKLIDSYYEEGKYVTAICAAPSILGHHNILKGKKATCYPGYEKDLYGAEATGEAVVADGKVITARGMGKAVELGIKLLEVFTDRETANDMAKTIQF